MKGQALIAVVMGVPALITTVLGLWFRPEKFVPAIIPTAVLMVAIYAIFIADWEALYLRWLAWRLRRSKR